MDGRTADKLILKLVSHDLQQLIEMEVADTLGTELHRRSEKPVGYSNGYQPGLLTSPRSATSISRSLSRKSVDSLPSFLEPRRRVDHAVYAAVIRPISQKTPPRKFDAMVEALDNQSKNSKSEVSSICPDIDLQVQIFLTGRWRTINVSRCHLAARPLGAINTDIV